MAYGSLNLALDLGGLEPGSPLVDCLLARAPDVRGTTGLAQCGLLQRTSTVPPGAAVDHAALDF
jgi:hypothetical protein